jgi:2-desacetyl-2-hydroxyethyl bacteriochlorophyllide A dehydrogenase
MSDARVVFIGKNDSRLEEFTLSPEIGPGDVRVRNLISLVSPGTELAVYRMTHRAFEAGGPMAAWVAYPFHPGYASVGEVEAVGSEVTGFAIGDIVWHPSPHATRADIAAARCFHVPAGLAPEDAVFFGLAQIAMTSIRRASAGLGERVLVSGLGLVGLLCARLYVLSGATVTAADLSSKRLQRGRRLGCENTVNLSETTLIDTYEAGLLARPTLSIEAAGVESNIDACLKVTERGGRVVLQGSPRKVMEIDPYSDIHLKGLTIIGAHERSVPAEQRARDVGLIFELCAGALKLDEVRTHVIPYEEAADLYPRLDSQLDDYLGVLLKY